MSRRMFVVGENLDEQQLKSLRALVGEIYHLDITPFTDATLWVAGDASQWRRLRRILAPVLDPAFAVTDAASQVFLDDVRRRLDSAVDPSNGMGLVMRVVSSLAEGDAHVLKLLLEVGSHPDVPAFDGWRPSHVCGYLARVDAAAAIFACRPNMTALDGNRHNPLTAAQMFYPGDDDVHSERPVLRPDIVKMIIEGNFQGGGFATIAELACRRKWFALKNLVRRQVVRSSEYAAKFGGKSAVEWARAYNKETVAREIEYFAGLPTSKLLEMKSKFHHKSRLQIALLEETKKVELLKIQVKQSEKSVAELGEMKMLLKTQVKQNLDLVKALKKKEEELEARKRNKPADSDATHDFPEGGCTCRKVARR